MAKILKNRPKTVVLYKPEFHLTDGKDGILARSGNRRQQVWNKQSIDQNAFTRTSYHLEHAAQADQSPAARRQELKTALRWIEDEPLANWARFALYLKAAVVHVHLGLDAQAVLDKAVVVLSAPSERPLDAMTLFRNINDLIRIAHVAGLSTDEYRKARRRFREALVRAEGASVNVHALIEQADMEWEIGADPAPTLAEAAELIRTGVKDSETREYPRHIAEGQCEELTQRAHAWKLEPLTQELIKQLAALRFDTPRATAAQLDELTAEITGRKKGGKVSQAGQGGKQKRPSARKP